MELMAYMGISLPLSSSNINAGSLARRCQGLMCAVAARIARRMRSSSVVFHRSSDTTVDMLCLCMRPRTRCRHCALYWIPVEPLDSAKVLAKAFRNAVVFSARAAAANSTASTAKRTRISIATGAATA